LSDQLYLLKSGHDICRLIGRAVIYNNNLIRRPRLRENAHNRFSEKACLIERRDDDRNGRGIAGPGGVVDCGLTKLAVHNHDRTTIFSAS
jgi:hypothetical protein